MGTAHIEHHRRPQTCQRTNERLACLLHSTHAASHCTGIRSSYTRIIRWLPRRTSAPRLTAPLHHHDGRQSYETHVWLHALAVRMTGKIKFPECGDVHTGPKAVVRQGGKQQLQTCSSKHTMAGVATIIITTALRTTAGRCS